MDELNVNNSQSRGAVTLSFDDGWKSIYKNALPILNFASLKATFYIVTGYLDEFQFTNYMNTRDIIDLYNKGHEIGSHTVSHRHLPLEPQSLVEDEIFLSKKYLEKLNIPAKTFAYPYGEYDERITNVVKNAGYIGARSTIIGDNDKKTDKYLLKVKAVKAESALHEVTRWIDRADNSGEWLILMFHQIDEEDREWSARPQMLSSIVHYIKEKKVRTITVEKGIKEMISS